MTITHEASTGVNPATSQGSGAVDVTYLGVAAGRRALLFASMKPSTNEWAAVTGWTLVAEAAGGTGDYSAGDIGPTRIGVWQRDLTGSETGVVAVARGAGSSNTMAGAMSAYSTDAGSWDTSIYVSGSDDTHDANPIVTFGAWSSTLLPGDLVVVAQAGDTDNAGTKSSPTLTQSGATFGAVAHRNNSLSGTGGDCSVASWDAVVLTGSTGTPTFTYTYNMASCGPFIAVRLRGLVVVDPLPSGPRYTSRTPPREESATPAGRIVTTTRRGRL